jgi:hypothetical protein
MSQIQELSNMMSAMADPTIRQQTINQIPQPIQELFTNPDKKLEILGQDGMLALIALQNSILHGQPMSDQDQQTIASLRDKLLAMVVPQAQ